MSMICRILKMGILLSFEDGECLSVHSNNRHSLYDRQGGVSVNQAKVC